MKLLVLVAIVTACEPSQLPLSPTVSASATPAASPSATQTPTIQPTSTTSPTATTTVLLGQIGGGGRIAFVSDRFGEFSVDTYFEIYLINVDGTNLVRLTENKTWDTQPVWSPDGQKIAFVSGRTGNTEIFTMNPDGGEITQITNNSTHEGGISWSPDGKKIIYESVCYEYACLFILDLFTGVEAPFRPGEILRYPSWSPDGAMIAYAKLGTGLFVANTDGSDAVLLVDEKWGADEPAWSPDGSQIAYVSDTLRMGTTQHDIFIVNVDGSGVRNLTNHPSSNWWPVWSPDGQWIAFVSDRDGDYEIYLISVDGTLLINLTNDPADDMYPSWEP